MGENKKGINEGKKQILLPSEHTPTQRNITNYKKSKYKVMEGECMFKSGWDLIDDVNKFVYFKMICLRSYGQLTTELGSHQFTILSPYCGDKNITQC